MKKNIFILFFTVWVFQVSAFAGEINLNDAVIVISNDSENIVQVSAEVLSEEIEKRTGIKLAVVNSWPSDKPVIAIYKSSNKKYVKKIPESLNRPFYEQDAFYLSLTHENNQPQLWILGTHRRGTLYGVGRLLILMDLQKGSITIPDELDVYSGPQYQIRGHQLGYRNTANSWDAWTPQQFDQYIRELALFGANCIENIPMQDSPSPHFKLPREEMNKKISEICIKYDMDYWCWMPAQFDLTDTENRTAALNEHEQFFKTCPRLDNVFFPGGDPGHNHPKDVMPYLKELTKLLKNSHPTAGVWISLQGFNAEKVDYFFDYLEREKPDWLEGVVSGPGSPSMSETRYRLPKQYKHRHYPDITHNMTCQYPVEWWDQAFALTLGREASNPQPYYYAKIFQQTAPFTDGFLAYSDGVHDDVNKALWSQLAWDPDQDVQKIVTDYCRLFFSDQVAEKVAFGIIALEGNWVGPIRQNGGIEATLAYWQDLERENPQLAGNWRWQLCLLRANYDAYQRRRLFYEKDLEYKANLILADVKDVESGAAMKSALALLEQADSHCVAPDLRKRIVDLCEDLYQSIGLQTSVPKYQGKNPERGCVLDFVDYPLNNRWWLEDEFEKISKLSTETEKLARIKVLVEWENPVSGSYYDNIGSVAQSQHTVFCSDVAPHFAWWNEGKSRARLSSQVFQYSPVLEYHDLDPDASYVLRVSGKGEAFPRIDGERITATLYNKEMETFKEFPIPQSAVKDGSIKLTFDRKPEELEQNWRQWSHISDVWIIKQ